MINDQLVLSDDAFLPPEKRNIGMVFQDFALFPHLNVLDNVMFGMRHSKAALSRAAMQEKCLALLAQVGLADLAKRPPHALSGGQQQRVALVRALAPEPAILFMDEPFSGLDVTLRAHIRELTLNLLKDLQVAGLMVTHDPEEAMFMSDRIMVMEPKKGIVQSGMPAEIYQSPQSAYVTKLFGHVNSYQGTRQNDHITYPLGMTAIPAHIETDQDIAVYVRADAIHMAAHPSATTLPATVLRARFLGFTSQIIARVGDHTLKISVPGLHLPRAGAEIHIQIDQDKVFAFAC
jgi:iron(III) transport system ATP-binding protein